MRAARSGSDVPRWTSMVEVARHRALSMGDERAYVFLEDGETREQVCTYAQVDAKARAVASLLRDRVARGSRVLLLYPPGLDYITAFFGCLYAGVVAVPAYPPLGRRHLVRLEALVQDSGAELALTVTAIYELSRGVLGELPALARLEWTCTDALPPESGSRCLPPGPEGDAPAMLQYTSGSTGAPKGVIVSHGNLVANSRVIAAWLERPPDAPGVTWLPPYHDMGLIGGILQPMYAGFTAIVMSPLDFAKRPARWLEAISRYRATVSGGPNFAYDLCVRTTTPEERRALDLSCWSAAFCGAEPVSSDMITRFLDAFAVSGFDGVSFYPAYGLAEATLAVSGKTARSPLRRTLFSGDALDQGEAREAAQGPGARSLVSCGPPLCGVDVRIVDPVTSTPLPERAVGELWLQTGSTALGYWNQPDATGATFQAWTADGSGPWLRTGDLGFLHEGELYVTGRLKDVIIIRGKKYSPVDIERAAERAENRLKRGLTIAFSVPGAHEDQLVIVGVPSTREPECADEVARAVRRAIAAEFELAVNDVCLVAPSAIPLTSSGKVQRSSCRAAYANGALKARAS